VYRTTCFLYKSEKPIREYPSQKGKTKDAGQKRAYRLLTVLVTFLLGIAFQFLLDQWLPSRDTFLLSLMIISICLVLILTISSDTLNVIEDVIDLATRSGIRAEYIEDADDGRSYQRSS